MNNKELFVKDLLSHTRKNEITWENLANCEKDDNFYVPKHLSKYPSYITFSGENNCFTYCVVKIYLPSIYYLFIVYLKGKISFSIKSDEMDNPFILKALFDSAAAQSTKKIIDISSKSIDKNIQARKDIVEEIEKITSTTAWINKLAEQTEQLKKTLEAAQKISSDIMRMNNSTTFGSITEVNNVFSTSTKECDSVTEDMPGNSAFYAVENLATIMKAMKPFIEAQSKLIKQLDPVFRNAKDSKMQKNSENF